MNTIVLPYKRKAGVFPPFRKGQGGKRQGMINWKMRVEYDKGQNIRKEKEREFHLNNKLSKCREVSNGLRYITI
jgi:hypothetical protein